MKYYIDSRIILDRKIAPVIYLYIMIIIVLTLSLIILITLFHYKTYYKVKGIVQLNNEEYYIRIYVPLENIKYLINNDTVKINRENYKYQIKSINDEYFTDNIITYQIIEIKINIPSKYKYNNLNLSLQFLKEDKKIIDYIIRR